MKSVDEIYTSTSGKNTIDEIVTNGDIPKIVTEVADGDTVEIVTDTTEPVAYIKEDGDKVNYSFIMYDDNGNLLGDITGHIEKDKFKRDKDYIGKFIRNLITGIDISMLAAPIYFVDWEATPGEIERITISDYE